MCLKLKVLSLDFKEKRPVPKIWDHEGSKDFHAHQGLSCTAFY